MRHVPGGVAEPFRRRVRAPDAVPAEGAFVAIDWSRPWLAPYRAVGEPLALQAAAGRPVAEVLNGGLAQSPVPPRLNAGPLHFIAQEDLPPGTAYEAHIAATAGVPTRDNLHDFFNGLMWLHHPALKRRLNEGQSAAIAAGGVGARRGALRDALTLFDESGAWLEALPGGDGAKALAEAGRALAEREWQRLFVSHRALWAGLRVVIFGHATLERLVRPYKAITAHLRLGPPTQWLAADPDDTRADTWAAKPFLPLPVLGVPGWWPANEASAFYADAAVFRPLREAANGRPASPARH